MIRAAFMWLLLCGAPVAEEPNRLQPPKHGNVYVIAHRGAHRGIPENTLAAYERAIEIGADFVEIDLRTTSDGEFVSIHNAAVDAYVTDGTRGRVGDLTLRQLKSLDIGSRIDEQWVDQRIPTLDEILKLCKDRIGIYLDLKDASIEKVASRIKQFGMERQVLWCIAPDQVDAVRLACPNCIPMPDPDSEVSLENMLRRKKPSVVAPVWSDFSSTFAAACHDTGVLVFVDEKEPSDANWQQALDWGANGIQTDDPEKLIEFLADSRIGTWPQWRGPSRNGKVNGGTWPDNLQETTLKQSWRVELSPSYSGPVVSKDKVFLTYTRGEEFEGVVALDRASGAQVWKTEWPDTMKVADLGTSMGSWIRATPALSGQDLFVAGMPDVLVCLDANSGAERWRVDFRKRHGTPLPELGFVCSPLVVEDAVYVQAADSLVKLDRKNGESIWRVLKRQGKGTDGMGQGSYSSPDLAVIHGMEQLLVANIDAIAGVDPLNGNVLWTRTLDSYDQGCILAPIAYRDGVFMSSRASRTGYYALTRQNEQFKIADGWKNKLTLYMSAPVVVDDFAYAHLKNGRFACIDLRTGSVNWISNRTFGKYCSMVYRKDHILALSNDGKLFLFHANPNRFVLADSSAVSTDETWGHLAVAGQDIYIRERNAIAAYQWQ